MSFVIASLGSALVTVIVQTLRWVVSGSRDRERLSWQEYMGSAEAWGAGWPFAMVLGTWMTLVIFTLALFR
jgi:hypothetical protein